MDTPIEDDRRRARKVSVLMVGVLAVSIAVAAALSGQGASADTGADILAQIRQDGLARYWPAKAVQQWQMRTVTTKAAEGRPAKTVHVGWRLSLRKSLDGGGFEGLNVSFATTGRTIQGAWEHWTLNADATEGTYRAGPIVIFRRALQPTAVDTEITLHEGRVTLNQSGVGQSEADAPDNYIPEGLVELACFLAANDDRSGQFRLILNYEPPWPGGRVRFAQMQVDSDSDVRSAGGFGVTTRTRSSMGESEATLSFDSSGLVTRRQNKADNTVETPATLKQVLATFPSVAVILRSIPAVAGFDAFAAPSADEHNQPTQ